MEAEIRYRVHKDRFQDPILSQINFVHVLTSSSLKILRDLRIS
jgi:hypothetical protein